MTVEPVALFQFWREEFAALPGVRSRARRSQRWTQVRCAVEERDGRHVAVPQWSAPPETPAPVFRLQLTVPRAASRTRPEITLVLQPAKQAETEDPEQRILAPILS